ncbi:PREDICTED: uncharacterized protein [Prunus dulcis]|uniref:PREDICTED: uncharacterized protein n=1 Tax=Prunus dulcis TaxID=3755 RepID=A0A5E4GK36_PRUDU|nr:hypothetical protein L3X38_018161 [Prunus dulcis]VVA39908.1 PREDICTED: uncharacterized protein [Prunus dulcis]
MGLLKATELGISDFLVASDSQEVVALLKGDGELWSNLGNILDDIRCLGLNLAHPVQISKAYAQNTHSAQHWKPRINEAISGPKQIGLCIEVEFKSPNSRRPSPESITWALKKKKPISP